MDKRIRGNKMSKEMHFCFSLTGNVKIITLMSIVLLIKCLVSFGYSPVQNNHSDYLKYIRNKSRSNLLEILQNYCLDRCSGGQLVSFKPQDNTCPSLRCTPCSCVRPACEMYGLCCPDVSDSSLPIDSAAPLVSRSRGNMESKPLESREYPILGCDKTYDMNQYVFIRSCPKRHFSKSSDTLRLCEDDVPIEDTTAEIMTRVVDVLTGVIYKNTFCAACNGVKQTLMFEPFLLCINYMSVYEARNPDEMLRLALKPESDCTHTQKAPSNASLISCRSDTYKMGVLNTCDLGVNSTSWEYDAEIERACHEMTNPVYLVYSDTLKANLKNIYCAICNGATATYAQCIFEIPPSNPPFFLLINYMAEWEIPKPKSTRNRACSQGAIESPLNSKCLDLKCSPGKLLKRGKCITAMPIVRGLQYNLQFWLVPDLDQINESAVNNTHTDMEDLTSKIVSLIDAVSRPIVFDMISIENISKASPSDEASLPLVIWIDCKLDANTNTPRDEIEQFLVEKLMLDTFRLQTANTSSVSLRTYLMLGKLDINAHCRSSYITNKNLTCKKIFSLPPLFLLKTKKTTDSYVSLRPTFTCSFVSFNKSEYRVITMVTEIPPRITVTLTLSLVTVNFTEISELNMMHITVDGVLNICSELFQMKTKFLNSEDIIFDASLGINHHVKSQYILTIIFMGASMLCLVLTLVTYFWFKVLRNMAGKNNMFLSFSLLLAQAILLAATHIPRHNHLCTAVGILTHFLWLWLFSWTFLCSVHMARVFTSSVHISSRPSGSQDVYILRRLIVSLLLPACVVTIVITTSFYSTSGRDIGYGAYVCYLDSPNLVGVTFVSPMALIICSNITCFLVTVYKIHSLRMQQTSDAMKQESYANLFVYVKLSSLTGALWTVAVAGEATDSNVLRFISIILNGLQGVFIFLSFTFNRRVISLYRTKLFRQSTFSQLSPTIPSNVTDCALIESAN